MSRSTVYIPLVPPVASGKREGQFIEVYAESYRFGTDPDDWPTDEAAIRQARADYDQKATRKYWDRVAAPLRLNSPTLYRSGCIASNAVRKLPFRPRLAAWYQFFKPNAVVESKRLYAVSAWGPTEGQSAELGLALALACDMTQVSGAIIVATGALSATVRTGSSLPLLRNADVKVHPVGSLTEKLQLLIAEIESGCFQALAKGRPFWLITPRLFESEGELQTAHNLPEVKILQSLGVTVVAVDWLSEALQALRANRSHYVWQDRLLQAGVLLCLVGGLVSGGWLFWRNAPVPMVFLPVSGNQAQPFVLCTQQDRQYAQPLRKQAMIPTVPVDSTLAWRIRIGDTDSIDAKLAELWGFQGYYVAVVVVAEQSPPTFDAVQVSNSARPLRVRPGDLYEGWIRLNSVAETNVLLVLAQRHTAFQADALRRQFQQRFLETAAFSKTRLLNVDAASDFLQTRVPGARVYPFVTVQEASSCPEPNRS